MFTMLIIAALIVAIGGAGAGAVLYSNEKKRRGLPSGGSALALPASGDRLIERTIRELRVGAVLTLDGKDFLVEGVIDYDEDGHRWTGARVVDGATVRWCVVGLERTSANHVRLLEVDPTDIAGYPPEALVLGEIRFALDKRGTATCKLHGDLGNLLGGAKAGRPEGHVERCRWWLYSAPGDDTALLEQWGSDYRVLRGKKALADTIDLIPGS